MALALTPTAAPVVARAYEDAMADFNSGEYGTAARQFRILAEQGDADAQTQLGIIYQFDRLGIKEDRIEALKWLHCLGR